ncbi:glycosyltransferase [Meiothermus hypogaeus]|uniref:Teichuronic acid biosynthesis glycosyltransferase TuaC n=2 Tax=Meiothermus hypogaeus TaxID=884155 RepID=A0ABX9MLJ5_9DEIN|nr:glycosyltransferase [Meiothermus hypogaeus]RIH76895.1 putative teichuronic acid biosynthesis glycosyltransferase TuaC [Meiothermus hypogaeus]GEM82830.1 putative teichuronic acid biosynthesis glycosyltransferase TuaC [Meiothermus hypogaeus NBRC 106114]GIW37310.1 MAG: putative teichuronic acid biosynthesis glycosyltransferase TuaC [Meiothermus sp.]
MRLLLLSPDFPSAVHPSACIFVQTQALELQRLGLQIEVHAPLPLVLPGMGRLKPAWRSYAQIPAQYEVEGTRVYRPRYLAVPGENLWGWPHLLKAPTLPGDVAKYDLVHAHFAHPEGTLGLWLKRRWRKPLVVTLHGDDANTYPYQNPRYMRYFRQVLAQADLVLAVSEAIRQRTQALTQRPVLTHRVGLRLSPLQARPDKSTLRDQLGLPQDRFVLLFVGMLWKYKGVSELAQALHLLDDESLMAVFIGDGPLRETLVSTSRTSVVVLGQQPNSLVRTYMAAADAFILPSYREGLPTVVVEAGAAGLPVIASQYGGTPELINQQTGFPLEQVSPEAIIKALNELRKNPQEARARAERLQAHVYEHYDAAKNARTLLRFYQQLLSKEPVS